MGSVMGGKKTTVPASGFFALPQEYRNAYGKVLSNVNTGIDGINQDMFRPMDATADESRALDMYRQGFAPTQQSLGSDISMLMNPFDQFVIDDINREANSANSILKQGVSGAGQMGSNRQLLGANDIEQTRLGTIGKFRQNQYNTSIDQILNKIIPQRQLDAAGLLGIGDFQRNLDSQQKTAPLQALSAQTGLLGSIPTQFGEFGTPQQTIKTGGGLGGMLGGISNIASLGSGLLGSASAGATGLPWLASAGIGSQLGGLGSLAAFMSDERLKDNIVLVGNENGHKLYEFSYIGTPQRFIGVMAQEVEKTNPEAVIEINGYKAVDYGAIGVNFRRAA